MKNYRKIYEQYHGIKIPKGMHIHHIDGNHSNNDPLNLEMLTPEEHWWLHLIQGDTVALGGKFIQFAANFKGKKHTQATIQKMCKPKSEEAKRNLSKARKGMRFSEAHKMKLSLAAKARVERNGGLAVNLTKESIDKIRRTLTGHKHSEQTKKKMSDAAFRRNLMRD